MLFGADIFQAASTGKARRLTKLLDRGTDPNCRDKKGNAPLHQAARNGHAEAARILLERGADVNARDYLDCSALWLAAWPGHIDVAQVLIAAGADVNYGQPRLGPPLREASSSGNVGFVRLLLESGADVNAVSENGYTALWLAVFDGCMLDFMATMKRITRSWSEKRKEQQLTIVEMLLDHGANPNAAVTESDYDGWTPLHVAAAMGDWTEVFTPLLRHGADPTIRNAAGQTPAELAVANDKAKHAALIAVEATKYPPQ